MKNTVYFFFLLGLILTAQQKNAADGSITITGTSFNNFTATSTSAVFRKNLIGTQTKDTNIQTVNFQEQVLVEI